MKNWKKKIKKMDCLDMSLVKLSVIAFVCFVISLWNPLAVYIMAIDWWWYLAAMILLAWKPCKKLCM